MKGEKNKGKKIGRTAWAKPRDGDRIDNVLWEECTGPQAREKGDSKTRDQAPRESGERVQGPSRLLLPSAGGTEAHRPRARMTGHTGMRMKIWSPAPGAGIRFPIADGGTEDGGRHTPLAKEKRDASQCGVELEKIWKHPKLW